jgi:hypothetical protein
VLPRLLQCAALRVCHRLCHQLLHLGVPHLRVSRVGLHKR